MSDRMFSTKIDRELAFPVWALQQVLVPVIVSVLAMSTASFLGTVFNRQDGRPMDPVPEALMSIIFFCGFAFLLAVLVRRIFPRAGATGKWIWVVPFSILVGGLVWDLARFPAQKVLAGFFYPSGEDAWAAYLLTFPTLACISYSLGTVTRAGKPSAAPPASSSVENSV